VATDKELEEELSALARDVERLRIMYQQYFFGMEKIPPEFQREQLEKRIRESRLNETRKAVYKFRFISLLQKLRTLEVYWDRMLRAIEQGKIQRGIPRDAGRPSEDVEMPLPAREPVATKPVQEKVQSELLRIFETFLEARKRLGLPVEGISFDAFVKTLEKQKEIHSQKLGVQDFAVEVVVKDGKVVLLLKPKQ
jgi:hypothetical protein